MGSQSVSLASVPAEITSHVSGNAIFIGDLINYTIEVRHSDEVSVQFPDVGNQCGDFEILNSSRNAVKQDGVVVDRFQLLLAAYKLGNLKIPAFRLKLISKTGRKYRASTQPASIEVRSLLGTESTVSIKDIKPIVDLGGPPTTSFSYRWVLLFALAVSLFLLYLFKKRREQETVCAPEVAVISPEEEALMEIEKLRRSELFKRKLKLFYIKVALVIKVYLEKRYRLKAKELTTYEIIHQMTHDRLNERFITQIEGVFQVCDLAKFARYTPTEEESKLVLEQASSVVRMGQAASSI